MSKERFNKIVKNPSKLAKKDLQLLKELNKAFPFFSISRAIQLREFKKNGDLKFERYLGIGAALSRDRKLLHDFVHNRKSEREGSKQTTEIENILIRSPKAEDKSIKEENSFIDWLAISNLKPIDRSYEINNSLKFTSKKPQINKSDDDYLINAPKEIIDDEYFMTETLAKLYLKQKNYEKAIQSYKILILKFPEKNSYFANQIKKIKKSML